MHRSTGSRSAQPTQTVDELSARIREVITGDTSLRNLAVRGELQNFKRHSSGHVYFTLVGKESRISGVLFRSHASGVLAWPEDGDEVAVTGSIDVYVKGGAYQLYATRILPIGLGAQSRAKEELRAALDREGLFDMRHKRILPRYPAKVAVVTSPTGAAVQDILKVSLNRCPFVDIVLIPAVVQGVDAPSQVVRALAVAGTVPGLDCVILARGGGAKDDLSPFDDERLVRAVRSCPIPVVTGIGHQIDRSLADLAADASLATPSAAAERVFPDVSEIRTRLAGSLALLRGELARICREQTVRLEKYDEKMKRLVMTQIAANEAVLDRARKDLVVAVTRVIQAGEGDLRSAAASLDALSPLSVLARGYAICTNDGGGVIKSVSQAASGQKINLRLHDGTIAAETLSVDSSI